MRNERLYKRLVQAFGDVRISNEDMSNESYSVNCPYCKDKRKRLSIFADYGTFDTEKRCNKKFSCTCYNERCVNPQKDDPSSFDTKMDNVKDLYTTITRGRSLSGEIKEAKTEEADNTPLEWPGKVIRLDRLWHKDMCHHAVQYVTKRGFSPTILGGEYGFVYCESVNDAKYAPAEDTILMPVYDNSGALYSWISRYIGDTCRGKTLKEAGIKKYYNCPGRSLSKVGYRLERLKNRRIIGIVEGIFDVVGMESVGISSTCLLTKNMSMTLKSRILKVIDECDDVPLVIVALDPDVAEAHNGQHHLDVCANQFVQSGKCEVLKVMLPSGTDPGSLEANKLFKCIQSAVKRKNPAFLKYLIR